MANNRLQDIRTQLTLVWNTLPTGRKSSDRVDSEGKEPIASDIATLSEPCQQLELGALTPLTTDDRDCLFGSEGTTPITKLNLPRINVNPLAMFWTILAAMVGGTGMTSYLVMIAVPPTTNCQGISPISADRERLDCAQVGAETQSVPKLRAAISLVRDWTAEHPLYGDSQRLLRDWSLALMKIGRKQLNQGQSERAIATLKIVPPSSPLYPEVQKSIGKWQQQAQNSEQIDGTFDRAMRSGDWNQAFATLQTVRQMRGQYWNTYKHDKMVLKLARERAGWEKLQAAQDALVGEDFANYIGSQRRRVSGKQSDRPEVPLPTEPAPILAAMKLANQIDKHTYVYQTGQQLRSRWSRQLVLISIGAYKSQEFDRAIDIVQKVPQDVAASSEAQDWLKLNRANITANKRHLLAVMDALAQVKRIPKTSPIATLARIKQSQWQAMLKRQTQFQWAKTIASFQQPATLAVAIDTAQQIPPQSEMGQAVQSEIADWSRQIQVIDNRVTLAKAKQIINQGDSLTNLRAAVKLASRIGSDQPLGKEATAAVSEWTQKIQTIEDTPILNRARALAAQGNLVQAVAAASRIAPGRTLSAAASAESRYWSLELQEIADRRTLDRAIAIYRQGQIATAIDLAATISRRSPIYSDARAYVADWRLLLAPRAQRQSDRG